MVSRRSLLIAGGGGVVAVAAPLGLAFNAFAGESSAGSSPASDGGQPVPHTLVQRRRQNKAGRQVTATPFALTHLGISWVGATAAVRLKTASGWGDWQTARGCPDTASDEAGGSALVAVAGATGYEVQVDGGSVSTVEINTKDGPVRTMTAPSQPFPHAVTQPHDIALPPYLSRAAWGADESRRVTTKPDGSPNLLSFFGVQTLSVHHEGNSYDTTLQKEHVRALYEFQTTPTSDGGSGLDDLGYHVLIDTDGTIYQGRFSDNGPIPVFGPELGDDGRPQMANGAHIPGFNAGNVGVVLLGDYSSTPVSDQVFNSLTFVLAALAASCRLDPLGTTNYVNPADVADTTRTDPPRSATVTTVLAHRDWNTANPQAGATACPGDGVYPRMDDLRHGVADLMHRFGLPT